VDPLVGGLVDAREARVATSWAGEKVRADLEGLWHATCNGSAEMKTSHHRTVLGALVALALFHLQLTGCLHGRAQCGSVDWVDRVEDRWLVVVDRGGASHTYRRSSDRETWVEGDALVDGLLRPDCRLAMRAEIERLRDELIR
jgi:hypothetical protein